MRNNPVEITCSVNCKTCASCTRRAETSAVERQQSSFFAMTETPFHFRCTCRQICFEDTAIKTFENAWNVQAGTYTACINVSHVLSSPSPSPAAKSFVLFSFRGRVIPRADCSEQ